MVTRGIITQIIGKTKAKVRIPIYDKVSTATDGTPDSELSTAIVCTFPGASPNFSVGDAVIVSFEQDVFTMPVVLGILYTDTNAPTYTDMNAGHLDVRLSATLPTSTTIGEISSEELQSLAGLRGNIQNQIDEVSSKVVGYYIEADAKNLVLVGIENVTPPTN